MHRKDNNLAWRINASGDRGHATNRTKSGVRPAIILKKDTIVSGGSIVEG